MVSWCHGAPGIMLSRLVLQATGASDDETAGELAAARGSTAASLERIASLGSGAARSLLRIDRSGRKDPIRSTSTSNSVSGRSRRLPHFRPAKSQTSIAAQLV